MRLTGPERVSRFACVALLLGTITIRPVWCAVDPWRHARWWYAYGDASSRPWLCVHPNEVESVFSGGWRRSGIAVDHRGACLPDDTHCLAHGIKHTDGFRPPAEDPWGQAWFDKRMLSRWRPQLCSAGPDRQPNTQARAAGAETVASRVAS